MKSVIPTWMVYLSVIVVWGSAAKAQDGKTVVSSDSAAVGSGQTRPTSNDTELRHWLESMVWHHHFNRDEIRTVTGLSDVQLDEALRSFRIAPDNAPLPEVDPPIFVLPYPGGRHPRIGFLDGAVEPQRETKLSVFAPWDRNSYVVLDAPEAIWSNLGLTYLAHKHIDTIWTKQGIELERLEWQSQADGSYRLHRELPNKIAFTVKATPHRDHLAIRMDLHNGTAKQLTDLRVQMCAMLRGLKGFDTQTNDNKVFRSSLAACRDQTGSRWVILGFEPNHRTWGNPPCPCLHSDPIIPDCPPGESRSVFGRLSFYQGQDIEAELARIDRIWNPAELQSVKGQVFDDATGRAMACRVTVQSDEGDFFFAEPTTTDGEVIRYEKQNWINKNSKEFHSSISAHPFELKLPPGKYKITAECGKEYFPTEQELVVGDSSVELKIKMKRWIRMAERGWYSGDAHVHRPIQQIKTPMMADDVNVALPMVYWTTRDDLAASVGDRTHRDDALRPAELIRVDDTHVIWPKNTEWEIFSIDRKPHTMGALFSVNHKSPYPVGIPPVRKVIEQTDREGAILDMDKHDWPFALVLPPMLGERLTYELANNHMWKTEFAFNKWNTPAEEWMQLSDVTGGGEKEWMEYTHRTYWTLLNSGLHLQPTAGTATGVHPVPIGYGRVYVKVDGGFDYGRWIEGLRAGRSFVTTGPMAWMERRGNQIYVEAAADGPIDSVEWIENGRTQLLSLENQQIQPDGSVRANWIRDAKYDQTTWVAVRVWQKSPTGRLRFAHSAPIWFDVPGKPIRLSEQEQAFLIRRMETELMRSRDRISNDVLDEYEQALKHYRDLAR